ncbi:uncharacterized protein [Thunnus thynnus]|uniref:uncharacterized protein n=1 Tax=Thunnus thynnus TaxID=8237 RepID=UPI0035280DD6
MGPCVEVQTGSHIHSQGREKPRQAKGWFFLLFLCVFVFYIIYTMSRSGIILSEEDVQELYRLIISWLDQGEDFGRHLRQLAHELESVNEKCNVGRAVGNTVSVLGGLATIGAGVATFLSAGAASLLGLAGFCGAVGSTVTLTSDLIESWLEQGTLEKAKKISEEYKRLGEEIDEQIGKITGVSGLAVADDKVIECILQAIAKKNEIPWLEVAEIAEEWVMLMKGGLQAAAVLKTSWSKGSQDVLSGLHILKLTLPDATEYYKRAINNNSVTGPSEELKNAADELLRSTQKIRAALNEIEKKMIKIWHRKYFYFS